MTTLRISVDTLRTTARSLSNHDRNGPSTLPGCETYNMMIEKNPVTRSIRRFLRTPEAELSRWQFAARYLFIVFRHGIRQLREDRAGQMAAALAFRTLFGLVPVFAIGMVLFRAFGGTAIFEELLQRIVTAANLTQIKMPDSDQTLLDFLLSIVAKIDQNVSFKSIGIIGLLLLGWAAIGLLTTIERSFNTICRAPENRSLSRRVPLYWMVITIGPALVYLSFSIQSRFSGWVDSVQWGASYVWALGLITSFCTTWLLLLSLFTLMPIIRMPLRAAAVGSFVSALLWTLGQRLLASYITTAFSGGNANYSVLYGSLGLIPIFMLWVYFMWIIVLFGLEVTSTLQSVSGSLLDQRDVKHRPQIPPVVDPAIVIPIMQFIASRFADGKPTTVEEITEHTRLNSAAVKLMLSALAEDRMINQVVDETREDNDPLLRQWTLARPADSIAAEEMLKTAHRIVGAAQGSNQESDKQNENLQTSLVAALHQAQLEAVGKLTLAQI